MIVSQFNKSKLKFQKMKSKIQSMDKKNHKMCIAKARILVTGLFSAMLVVMFAASSLKAQDQPEKKVTIDITITENGETKKIAKEIVIDADGDVNIDELLKDIDELKDIDVSGDSKNIQIIVKKLGDDEDLDFNFDMDFNKEEVEEMHKIFMSKRMEMIEDSKDKGFLGVYVKSMGEDAGNKGSVVNKVIANSGAEKAGLEEGDIITKVNGKSIDGHKSLVEELRSYKPGESISIDYMRDGKNSTASATLQERPSSSRANCTPGHFRMESFGDFDSFEHNMIVKAHGYSGAFLGVSPAKEFDGDGAKIGRVYDNSAAKEMGLQENDVIHSVNGERIVDFGDLKKAVAEMEEGDKIKLQFVRDGKKMKKAGELKARPVTDNRSFNYKCCDKDSPKCCNKSKSGKKVIVMNIEIEDIEKEDSELLKENSGMEISERGDMGIQSIEFLPNPSTGKFKLGFKPLEAGRVDVRIVDMNGKTVYEENMGSEKNSYDLDIDISNQPDGIYFLTLTQNGKKFNKKLIKQ